MMNGVNYFSMHRQLMTEAARPDSTLRSDLRVEASNVQERTKTEKLEEGAKAFESYFIQSLLKEMRKGVPKGEEGGVGLGEEMYQSMFDEAIAEKITESGGIGLAKLLTEKLSSDLKSSNASTNLSKGAKVFEPISR